MTVTRCVLVVATIVCEIPWISVAAESNPRQKLLVPLPQQIPAPENNRGTPEAIALGKQLFFDPRLSGDNTTSCATCHQPEKAFSDGLKRAKGVSGKELARNTPTLLNTAFSSRLFWDGRATSLEDQAMLPLRSSDEMNQALDDLVEELNQIPSYVEQFQKTYGARITTDGIAKSLAAFQRSLVTAPSPFDRYLAGDKQALSASAKRGLELFQGDAGCVRCHRGPLLSDGAFYRLGVSFVDNGLAGVTRKKEDTGKFRTPSLRNIAQTAPYMHNGSMKTLDDVVTFYYRGVPSTTPDGLALDIQPLVGQSFSEVSDIVSFLESLTGELPLVMPPRLP